MEQNVTIENGMRPLTMEELTAVSGGIWPLLGAIAIVAIGCIAESYRHRLDPGALRREGMGN